MAQADGSQSFREQTSRTPSHSSTNVRATSSNATFERDNGTGNASSAVGSTRSAQPRTINVVLFGETCARKSFVINLIARNEAPTVSPDVDGCTMGFIRYNARFDDMNVAIFDTVGLEEPQIGVKGYLKAIQRAYELIVELRAAGGIHLLLFCMLGGRITTTTQSNYRLFFECLCGTKVPIALVFTSLVNEVKVEDWWTRNKTYTEHYGIKSDGFTCLKAVQDDTPVEDLAELRNKILELIKTTALDNNIFLLEPHPWIAKFGKAMLSFIRKLKRPKKRDVMQVLTRHCKLVPHIANKIVDAMESGHTGEGLDHTPSAINVILFGETGVGKSSVVNLIAQQEVAKASPDADGCTLQSTRYDISFDNMDFAIFDTVGLVQPQMEVSEYLNAIKNVCELIFDLDAAGGVHLLLFCIRGCRITATTQNNYRLFYEYLCSKMVSIALIVTGLEQEVDMEDWWTRNEAKITSLHGIKSDDHACITTVQDDTLGEEDPKYTESRRKIRELLKTCSPKTKAFSLEPRSWLARVGNLMRTPTKEQKVPGRKDIMQVLTQRCKLDSETARWITEKIERSDMKTEDGNKDGPDERGRSEAGKESLAGLGGQALADHQDKARDGYRNGHPEGEDYGREVESGTGGPPTLGLNEQMGSEERTDRRPVELAGEMKLGDGKSRPGVEGKNEGKDNIANRDATEGENARDASDNLSVTQDVTEDELSTAGWEDELPPAMLMLL